MTYTESYVAITTGSAHVAHGIGHYENVAFTTTTLCSVNGVELRKEGTFSVRYAILMDGETLNRFESRKQAEELFIDFAGITPRRFKMLMGI